MGAYFKLESHPAYPTVSFTQLQERLLRAVLLRLLNGEVTERSLARIVGVSQPQIHNVLKGKRRLQPDLADQLLLKLDISIVELLQMQEIATVSDESAPARKRPGRASELRSSTRLFA